MKKKTDYTKIPKDGVNPYADHPGFTAQGCKHQHTVTERNAWGTIVRAGFGCLLSGGHCLPHECNYKGNKS